MASEETKITSGSLIAAEKVEGTVYNLPGEKLGTVDDIMLDEVRTVAGRFSGSDGR
jgi:hypothetical protein